MHRVVIILCLIGTMCTGALVPQSEDVGKQQQPPITQKPVTMNNPNYSTGQDNHRISSSPYYYPTYPEYTNNGYGAANNKGYAVQSGYEGYLMPTMLPEQKNTQWSAGNVAFSLLPLSSRLILYGARAGSFLLHITLLVLLGGVFTTLICTFTPICDITFPGLRINKNQVKEQVAELARMYITPESLNAATLLVTKAIDNYAAMQHDRDNNVKQDAAEKTPDNAKIQ